MACTTALQVPLSLLVAWGIIYQYPLQDKIPIVGLVVAGTLTGPLVGKLVCQWRGTWISVSVMNKGKVKGKAIIKKHSTQSTPVYYVMTNRFGADWPLKMAYN